MIECTEYDKILQVLTNPWFEIKVLSKIWCTIFNKNPDNINNDEVSPNIIWHVHKSKVMNTFWNVHIYYYFNFSF